MTPPPAPSESDGDSAAATALVPPRPNLGPEPWRGDGPTWLAPTLLVATAGAAALAWALARRARRPSASENAFEVGDDATAEERLLALCGRIRARLAERAGLTLRAKTTEELAVDPRVVALLPPERLERIRQVLAAGDRIKFARRDPGVDLHDRLAEWTAWAAEIDARDASPARGPDDSSQSEP